MLLIELLAEGLLNSLSFEDLQDTSFSFFLIITFGTALA
jgi:hypothetical protein